MSLQFVRIFVHVHTYHSYETVGRNSIALRGSAPQSWNEARLD